MRMLIPFLLLTGMALAQTTLGVGSVDGTIRDESGALIVGARVILNEQSKGLLRQSESDSDGAFLFPSVIAGAYSLRVEKQGFSSARMTDLRIGGGEQASVAITLYMGAVHTTIAVLQPTLTELDA